MGYVTANGPDSLFWRAVHGLKKDEPGRLATADGVYLLRYINQREGSQEANFEDYKGEIRAILLAEKLNQVYEDLLRELKAKDNKIYYY
jgi:parvulin-like peptidyl-prolyl isomerase